MRSASIICLAFFLPFSFCSNGSNESQARDSLLPTPDSSFPAPDAIRAAVKKKSKTIHVYVALCDNKYQGIVPVGKSIGNGQDADNNLYWGCTYGIRTYFKKKSSDWIFLESKKNINSTILERILFKHKTENIYLLADAWDGQYIKQTTIDFLDASAGDDKELYVYKGDSLYFGGASDLVSYIGHDGLMDFSLPLPEKSKDSSQRNAIILACYSKNYFSAYLQRTGAKPLVWTTHLMAPEAYTLHDALRAWIQKKPDGDIRQAAAEAYARYQKCSIKAAKNLLVTGY